MGSNYLGISLGSSNIFIYRRGKGIVLGEPSVIATETYSGKTVAAGIKAKRMIGRVPDTITVTEPVQRGVIADFKKTAYLLKNYIDKVKRNKWGLEIIISVPSSATAVERRAVMDAAKAAGGRKIHIIEEPVAAALGCGLEVFQAKGHLIVDIGGGKTEISVVSYGGVVYVMTVDSCAGTFDRDIINYVRKNYNILIGESTAEEVKMKLGSVIESDTIEFITVNGRDLLQGLPVSLVLSTDDVRDAVKEGVDSIIEGIIYTMEHIDPDLTSDIIRNRIHLVGGGSLINGWQELILKRTGIEAEVGNNPLECVALGAGNSRNVLNQIKLRKVN